MSCFSNRQLALLKGRKIIMHKFSAVLIAVGFGLMLAFAAHECTTASLTVTTANENAVRLYEKLGFVRRRSFAAHVWDFR